MILIIGAIEYLLGHEQFHVIQELSEPVVIADARGKEIIATNAKAVMKESDLDNDSLEDQLANLTERLPDLVEFSPILTDLRDDAFESFKDVYDEVYQELIDDCSELIESLLYLPLSRIELNTMPMGFLDVPRDYG